MNNLINLYWDIDGTLVNTGGLGVAPFNKALSYFLNCQVDISSHNFSGFTDYEIAQEMGIISGVHFEDNILQEIIDCYTFEYKIVADNQSLAPITSAFNFLNSSSNLFNIKHHIASGNCYEGGELKLGISNLKSFFQESKFYSSVSTKSRDKLIESIEFDPNTKNFIIGDTPRDIQSAKNAKVPVIAVSTGNYSREELASHAPDYLLDENWAPSSLFKILED